MKRFIILLAVVMAVLLIMTACGNSENQTSEIANTTESLENTADNVTAEQTDSDIHEHSFGEWTVLKDATCGEDGEKQRKCSVCEYIETEKIPSASVSHTYTHEGDFCPVCKKEVTVRNFTSKNDYLTASESEQLGSAIELYLPTFSFDDKSALNVNIPKSASYVRVVGSETVKYDRVYFTVDERTKPLQIDFINVDIELATSVEKEVIKCDSNIELTVGFYGSIAKLSGANGKAGSVTFDLSTRDGGNGKPSVSTKGTVILVCGTQSVVLSGGDGGNGVTFCTGGNGATGIVADQIYEKFEEGFNIDNITINGGKAGTAKSGYNGKDGDAVTIEIQYK